MALSHVCQHCGLDLARVRAAREPHYGLMIVRCPDCTTVAARRRHPLSVFWRDFRRFDWAITVLAVNLALFAGLISMTISCVLVIVDMSADMTFDALVRRDWFGLAVSLGLLPLFIGTWLTAGLHHWRRRTAWIVFGGVAGLGLLVAVGFHGLDLFRHWVIFRGGDDVSGWEAMLPAWRAECLDRLLRSWSLLWVMMVVAVAGIGPGRALAWLLGVARSMVWRFRRGRLRRERQT